jgi:hypothetical protein
VDILARIKEWSTTVDGLKYNISFKPNNWSGKHALTVNGDAVELKKEAFQAFKGIDQPVILGSKEARFVLIGSKADIAIDGFYLDSKKPYMPLEKVPKWAWVFIVLCLAIPVIAMGGAVPAVLAILGSMNCVRVSRTPNLKTPIKLLICTAITAAAWILFYLFLVVISGL